MMQRAKGYQISLTAQPAPALGDDNRVSRILRIVFYRGRKTDATGVQIDELTQVSNILRGLIRNATDGVAVDHQLGGTIAVCGFVGIEHGTVGDAAAGVDALTA